MAEENTSPGGTSATQTPPPPATGNASGSATPPAKPDTTLEEALKRITELENSHKNATEEVERHRKKLTAYEKQEKEREAATQAAKDAELGELERERKQRTAAEQQIQHYKQQLVMAQVKLAAKDKGIIDPDLASLAIQSTLEYGDDGMPTNLEKALENLIKNKPYLVPAPPAEPAPTPAQTAPTQQSAPPLPAMNVSSAGRQTIPGPGGNTPGRIPQWNEVFKRP